MMILAFHILVTALMVLAAVLQLAILRDPLLPNLRAVGSCRLLQLAAFVGLAVRLCYVGIWNHYVPPIPAPSLMCLGMLALGTIGIQLDRLRMAPKGPGAFDSAPTPLDADNTQLNAATG